MSLAPPPNTDAEAARALERRLAQARRLAHLDEALVAGVVHDLRTPLMVIKLSAEVALARSHDDAVQQAARRIRTSSDRMARLFDHLLNLARVDPDLPELELAPGDLGVEVDAVLAEARRTDPGATFAAHPLGSLEGVFDAALLRRTFAHIVATALRHAGESRTVTLHLDGSNDERIWIRIATSGVIPPEVQEQLYSPGPHVAGRDLPGPGLGLHAIEGDVRAHGGSVIGRSRATEGTVFELLLPRDASGPA